MYTYILILTLVNSTGQRFEQQYTVRAPGITICERAAKRFTPAVFRLINARCEVV